MKTEKILFAFSLCGILLKLFNVVGSSIISVFSLSLLALLYFPFGFYFFCDKNIKTQNIALSIVSGLLFSMVPIGILFKVQSWHDGYMYLVISIATTPIIFFISYYLKSKEIGELINYYHNMINRSLILTIISVFFYLAPIKWNW